MGWRNRSDSRVRDAEPRPEYPWMQWVNRGASLSPHRTGGGFFVNEANLSVLGDPVLPGGEPAGLVFSNDSAEAGMFLEAVDLAVMGSRFAWRVQDGNRTRLTNAYQPGARAKMQVLALLKAEDPRDPQDDGSPFWVGPVLLTLTGTVNQDVTTAIRAHRQAVAKATAGQGAAAWFWMHLVAGTPEKRGTGGNQSQVTPIVYAPPDPFDPDALYVGEAAADYMETIFDRVQAWQNEWGEGTHDAEPEPTEPEPTEPEPTAPKPVVKGNPLGEARERWSEAWNELKQRGLGAPSMDNHWSAAQIDAATDLLKRAAKYLDQGGDLDTTAAHLIAAFEKL